MYLVMQLIHVLSVVFFAGNITVAVFWKMHGDRTRDARIMAHTIEGLIRSDRVFTMPAVLLLVITGFGAAGVGRLPVFETGWIFWSIVMVVISGLAYMVGVVPAQKKMAALTHTAVREERHASTGTHGAASGPAFDLEHGDRERYDALTRSWNLWGSISLIAVLVAITFMVLKPSLPGL